MYAYSICLFAFLFHHSQSIMFKCRQLPLSLGMRSKGHASSDEISPTLQTRGSKDNFKFTKFTLIIQVSSRDSHHETVPINVSFEENANTYIFWTYNSIISLFSVQIIKNKTICNIKESIKKSDDY